MASGNEEAGSDSAPVHLIFGANTDVGKTVLTAGLLRAASKPSHSTLHYTSALTNTNYIKPLQCGGSDEGWVRHNAPCVSTSKTLFRWETPASPHVAARMENYPVSDEEVLSSLQAYLKAIDVQVPFFSTWIETAGGVLSPSSSSPRNDAPLHAKDGAGWGWKVQADLYRPLQNLASVVLVGDGKLGGISVTLASLEALLNRNYNVAGILLLRNGQDDYAEDVNQRALQEYAGSSSSRDQLPSKALQSPIFSDPERSIVSLPKLPPEPEPLTDWYESPEVKTLLETFVHDHLFSKWRVK
jgi:dethiobiotin synthetase/adenosylmethionine--8-amino-7-oxononanoate aminotransferase